MGGSRIFSASQSKNTVLYTHSPDDATIADKRYVGVSQISCSQRGMAQACGRQDKKAFGKENYKAPHFN